MSLRANIDHLAHAPGIDAALVMAPGAEALFRGAERWREVLMAAVELQHMTAEPIVRFLTGGRTIMVQSEGRETAAVVLPTGHPAAKSVRRMIRRLARRVRKPLARAEPATRSEEVAPTTDPGYRSAFPARNPEGDVRVTPANPRPLY
ncbi:MAG: hypothetical protein D6705_11610 [Deltaproteobacteria bacterium]|nr:MAG: hypothetical protein D6705_11610 [Deltaproteobacteria bacterium]